MPPVNFSMCQIRGILDKAKAGASVTDICVEHGITRDRLEQWQGKYTPTDDPQAATSHTRDRFISSEGAKKKNIHDFYKENINNLPSLSFGYDDY